jgi:hypothetical protein
MTRLAAKKSPWLATRKKVGSGQLRTSEAIPALQHAPLHTTAGHAEESYSLISSRTRRQAPKPRLHPSSRPHPPPPTSSNSAEQNPRIQAPPAAAMGLPLVQAISSASSPSSCARLTALLAGTAPARRATARMAPVKEFPFAAAAARFAGGGRGDSDLGGGGGARRAGADIYTALHLPSRKVPPFASSGGGAVLCLPRRADSVDLGDGDVVAGANEDGDGGVGASGGDRCIAKKHGNGDSEGAAAGVDQRHAEKASSRGGNRADHACWYVSDSLHA